MVDTWTYHRGAPHETNIVDAELIFPLGVRFQKFAVLVLCKTIPHHDEDL